MLKLLAYKKNGVFFLLHSGLEHQKISLILRSLHKQPQNRHISTNARHHMTSSPTILLQRVLRAYLGLDISVVVVLEEQGGRLGVVLSGSNVQGRQADLAFGIVLQEDGDNLVMTLLKGNGQRSEAILEEKDSCLPLVCSRAPTVDVVSTSTVLCLMTNIGRTTINPTYRH